MELLLAIAIVAVVGYVVSLPLRRRAAEEVDAVDPAAERLADLEARKQVKYREIRDAEADHAAGKLSEGDFERLDAELRREAIEILKEADRLRGGAERPLD
jgi:hypothetical protein